MNKREVIKRIGKARWLEFLRFMEGQTIGWKDGQADYFTVDVENFLSKNRFFD